LNDWGWSFGVFVSRNSLIESGDKGKACLSSIVALSGSLTYRKIIFAGRILVTNRKLQPLCADSYNPIPLFAAMAPKKKTTEAVPAPSDDISMTDAAPAPAKESQSEEDIAIELKNDQNRKWEVVSLLVDGLRGEADSG